MNTDSLPEKIITVLRRAVFFLFLPVIGWTVFTVYWSGTEKYSLLFPVLAAILTFALFMGRRTIRKLIFRLSYRKCIFTGVVLAVIGFIGMLVIAFASRNRIENNWDYGLVFKTAAGMTAEGTTIPSDVRTYFAMYGNNALFLRILLAVLKGFSAVFGRNEAMFLLDCSIVLNCVIIILSILICSCGLIRIYSIQQSLLMEILLLLMAPFYLYAAFTYTDVYGLLPAALVMFFMAKAFLKREGIRTDLFIAAAGAAAAFGYMMKGTVVIFLIAPFCVFVLAKEFAARRLRCLAVYTCVAFLTVFVLTWSNHSFLRNNGIPDEYRKEKEFPPVHFLMMALNPDYSGQYNEEDVLYTESFPGAEAKKEADRKELKDRLSRMGAAGTLNHIFVKKAKYIYGTGTAGAPSYIVRAPLKKSALLEFLGSNTVFFEITLIYKAILEGFILVIAVLTMIRKKQADGYILFLKTCWIGMFCFFCIWESHPRYTFVFLPLIGALAVTCQTACDRS